MVYSNQEIRRETKLRIKKRQVTRNSAIRTYLLSYYSSKYTYTTLHIVIQIVSHKKTLPVETVFVAGLNLSPSHAFEMSFGTILRCVSRSTLKHTYRATSNCTTRNSYRMSGLLSSIYPLRDNLPLSMRLEQISSYHTSVIALKETKTNEKFHLKLETVNEHLRKMEYAVRGVVPMRAGEIENAIQNVSRPS